MTEKVFVDTNILIYAHDIEAGRRHETARDLVKTLWREANGAISIQVLQEFYVNITRKIPVPLPRQIARHLVETYAVWEVVLPCPRDLMKASAIEERHQVSFWDAMIIATALKAGASTLWTEDLSHGKIIEGIRIINPLSGSEEERHDP
jgi:predicted nucleic acid-binding protein